MSRVLAVLPAFNEKERIKETIDSLKGVSLIDKIIVVDDGSKDSTFKVAVNSGVNVIRLDKNSGKGYCIKRAIKYDNFEYLVLVDSDVGETSIEVEKLIIPVLSGATDVTIARFPSPTKKGGFGLVKGLAKLMVYLYTKDRVDSVLSGQRVYKKSVIDVLDYIPNRFGVELAMTVGVLRKGYKIKEIDVNMSHRETRRNIRGFVHRGRQFFNILFSSVILFFRR